MEQIDGDFINDLINYFGSKQEVIEAYFGFACTQVTKANQLIPAVYHNGQLQDIQRATWSIKTKYFSDSPLYFASNEIDKDLFEFIKSHNFSFYFKEQNKLLEQKIMQRWFEKLRFEKAFKQFLKHSKIITLVKDFDPSNHFLTFQSYTRNSDEFVPLFSDKEMISKSGMAEIYSNLTVMQFDWERLNEVLNKKLDNQFFVLNPGTPFEVEILHD
jgi:hypothetical protein